jgi:hypothetical protein
MISTQFPVLKEILNANTGRTIKGSIFLNSIDLLTQFISKAAKKDNIQNESSKRNMIIKDTILKNIAEDFIKNSAFPSNIFSAKGITKVIEDHYNLRRNNEYLIGVLLTFIATYNLFFLNNYKTIPDLAYPFTIK